MDEITLDCGHGPTRDQRSSGLGTGYATWSTTGETLCYDCADAREREHVADPATDSFCGYVMGDADRSEAYPGHGSGKGPCAGTVTTWTGGPLAVVTHVSRGRKRYSANGLPMHRTTVYATTPDGRHWFGQYQPDGGNSINMRLLAS